MLAKPSLLEPPPAIRIMYIMLNCGWSAKGLKNPIGSSSAFLFSDHLEIPSIDWEPASPYNVQPVADNWQ